MHQGLPAATRGFFGALPNTVHEADQGQWELYQETLYQMRRPITVGNWNAVQRFIGRFSPSKLALADEHLYEELNGILELATYPEASAVGLLESFVDGSTELAMGILHFNNPAYPLYDAQSVGGLQHLGFKEVRYLSTIEGDTVDEVQKYIDAIQMLKDNAPYQAVPEHNYYLTRIIQLGLWRVGLKHSASEARDRPRPTLR